MAAHYLNQWRGFFPLVSAQPALQVGYGYSPIFFAGRLHLFHWQGQTDIAQTAARCALANEFGTSQYNRFASA